MAGKAEKENNAAEGVTENNAAEGVTENNATEIKTESGVQKQDSLTDGQKQAHLERSYHMEMEQAKQETTTIKLPFLPNHEDEDVFVSVNGYRYLIQRGIAVEVPVFVAEALRISEQQKMDAHRKLQVLQARAEEGAARQTL